MLGPLTNCAWERGSLSGVETLGVRLTPRAKLRSTPHNGERSEHSLKVLCQLQRSLDGRRAGARHAQLVSRPWSIGHDEDPIKRPGVSSVERLAPKLAP